MKHIANRRSARPYFSICIPQYNRTSFLLEACRSIASQAFRDFEICISDDCSTDGRERELLDFLEEAGLQYVYVRQSENKRYDGNLRTSIELANGEFCFLLGNDDALASASTLYEIHSVLQTFAPVDVAITNYKSYATGKLFRRMRSTGVIGAGPGTAARCFRDFSFVSGIVLDTDKAKANATCKWDGSEMYQMFLGCRIIAGGGRLLGIDTICVREGIKIAGESVDSYASGGRLANCPIIERKLPMTKITALVADALAPYQQGRFGQSTIDSVATQLLAFTYPFWLIEYRRVQSWRYSFGVFLGLRPQNILEGISLSLWRRTKLRILYAVIGCFGLLTPVGIFRSVQGSLYAVAKTLK